MRKEVPLFGVHELSDSYSEIPKTTMSKPTCRLVLKPLALLKHKPLEQTVRDAIKRDLDSLLTGGNEEQVKQELVLLVKRCLLDLRGFTGYNSTHFLAETLL